jgi:hypothetical protein
MTIYWSRARTGFFDSRINPVIPDDAVEITEGYRGTLLGGTRKGQVIAIDKKGFPLLRDAPPTTTLELEAAEREWRDAELAKVVWLRDRHRDQIEAKVRTTLDSDRFAQLLIFIQQLRDWPQSEAFPDIGRRPVAPAFAGTQFR